MPHPAGPAPGEHDLPGPSAAPQPQPARTPALEFARRHAAVVLVALVVAVGIAVTYLFRANSMAVPVDPVSVSAVSAAEPDPSASIPLPSGLPGSPSVSGSMVASASGAGASAPPTVTVQVLGPVRRPGVVTLPEGSRVKDALARCGGLLPSADAAELNLAAVLSDAQQIIIGSTAHPRGEVRSGSGSGPATGASASGADTGSADAATTVIDLNSATLAQLDTIPGVGPVTAQNIVDWRTQHGRFTSINELQEIDGIGPKTFARIAPHVRV